MTQLTIDIIYECSGSVGLGHYKRSKEIYEQLKKIYRFVTFIEIAEHLNSFQQILSSKYASKRIRIYDVSRDIEAILNKDREYGYKVIALDYLGRGVPDYAIGVNPMYPLKARIASLIGLEYAIIRNEFRANRDSIQGDYALVILGGADIRDDSMGVAKTLAALGLRVKLVLGPLAKKCYVENSSIDLIYNPGDISSLYSECKFAITNGGTCMLEAMYYGKPVVVCPQTYREQALAEHAREKNAIVGIGLDALKRISEADINLIGQTAKECVDGYGIERITQIVSSLRKD